MKKKRFFTVICVSIIGIFAVIGFVFTAVFIGMQFGVFNVKGSSIERNKFFTTPELARMPATPLTHLPCNGGYNCAWSEAPEWVVVREGLIKDKEVIARVSNETGISARLIASVVVPEQLRFFSAEREVFKRYFEPLKILGSLSQFSLGVSGIKEKTAQEIETYASDPSTPFYPGKGYDRLVAYADTGTSSLPLFDRLTDEHDHYYSYLYTAIFLKEIESQWARAGYDISNNAGVLGTLFNIGFTHSEPKSQPLIGGAEVTVASTTYTFGQLGELFFTSDELQDIFPR